MLTPALLAPETSAVLILDYQQHVMDGIHSVGDWKTTPYLAAFNSDMQWSLPEVGRLNAQHASSRELVSAG